MSHAETPPVPAAAENPSEPAQTAALALAEADDHPLVEAFLADQLAEPPRVVRAVHGADAMLGYLAWLQDGDPDAGLWSYFRTGLSAYRSLEPVLRWRFGALDRAGSILDFASGHGRATRFLVSEVAPERVWISEIKPQAVDFQRRRFGVHGFVSATDPQDLAVDRTFDAILVSSLFTHLPRATFAPWLGRLLSLLAPSGVLAFTVHDVAVMLPGRTLGGDGFYFESMSEDEDLDLGDYGSTWVSEEHMAGELARLVPGCAWKRFPKALWHLQDLYVVVKDAGPPSTLDLQSLVLQREPEGYLDGLRLEGRNRLFARGWAVVHPDAGGQGATAGPARIEIHLNGERIAGATADGAREDVAQHLGEDYRRSGWELSVDLPSAASPVDIVLLKALTPEGREAVLHLSTLQGAFLGTELSGARHLLAERARALGHTQRLVDETRAELDRVEAEARQHRHRADHTEAVLRAMEASRFWRARNAWFRLKKSLGLVDRVEPGPRPQ